MKIKQKEFGLVNSKIVGIKVNDIDITDKPVKVLGMYFGINKKT